MILTCPRCAARYVVGEDQVGPQGRKVKCTTCGEIWQAAAERAFAIPGDPYLVAPPDPEPADAAPEGEIPAPAAAPPPLHDELRRKMRARARRQSEQGRVVLWGAMATLVVATVGVIVFRREIVQVLELALR